MRGASTLGWRLHHAVSIVATAHVFHTAPQQLAPLASLTTAVRFVHSGATTPPSEVQLAEEVLPFVPLTFTSVPQISRQMPAELMERIASPVHGGLRQLLSRHPGCFETKEIGSVHVARRKPQHRHDCKDSQRRRGATRQHRDGAAVRSSWQTAIGAAPRPEATTPASVLQQLFPDFLVPVRALWATLPVREEAEVRQFVLTALQKESPQRDSLIFHAHPMHCAADPSGQSATVTDEVLENGYVQLRSPSPYWSSPSWASSSPPPPPFSVAPAPPSASFPDVRSRLADYEIQPYEWYRVARVLPTSAAEVEFDKALHDDTAALLPSGRDVWQVLLSAPDLFTVRYDTSSRATPSSAPRVWVRFHLHARYVPSGVDDVEEAALLRDLDSLAADREANRCGLNTRQRRHKRRLQQQLTFLRTPSPYFDHRVLAQHLFDLLPLRDGVHQSALLGMLPPHAVSAFPQNVTDLLKDRTDLFRLSDARHGVLVQRADAPASEEERTVASVDGEEVLQCLFTSHSTRTDPRDGTTISRNLPRLPRLIRERLFAMQDVERELLALYPDKVEVLLTRTPSTTAGGALHQTKEQYEREQRELQNVRGRRDFLVPFRFVGEWAEKLMVKYRQQQEKEAAKRGAPRRSMGSWRPRH